MSEINKLRALWLTNNGTPTIFTGHLAIPRREQWAEFVSIVELFYAKHTDEEIETLNRRAAQQWVQNTYATPVQITTKRQHRDNAPGYVYLVQSPSGAYKIGLTKNPNNRAQTFGVQLPFEVEFIALIQTDNMKALEAELHKRYAAKRVNGEWFALDSEDVEYIKGLAE